VRNLYQGVSTGRNSIKWNCADDNDHPVSGGIYICQLRTSNGVKTNLLSYLK
jgi:hypothetical protein